MMTTLATNTSSLFSFNTVTSFAILPRALKAIAVRRERKALAGLSDAALADLGLTRTAALTEAARPMWDVPSHRVC